MDKDILKLAVAAIRKEMRDRVGKKLLPSEEKAPTRVGIVVGKADPEAEEGSDAEEAMESPKEEAAEPEASNAKDSFHAMIAKALKKKG